MARRFPPPFPPEELAGDIVLVTHDHLDHLDPGTLSPSPALKAAVFCGSSRTCGALGKLGVGGDRLREMKEGDSVEVGSVKVSAIRAVHDEGALGFVVGGNGGLSAYFVGDSRFDPSLGVAGLADILVVPINGKMGNMGAEDAARLAKLVNPKWAVPVHYDLMRANGEDPAAFEQQMEWAGLRDRARVLFPMQPLLVTGEGNAVVPAGRLTMSWECGRPVRSIDLPAGYAMRVFRETDISALAGIYRRTLGPDYGEGWFRESVMGARFFSPDRLAVVDHAGFPVACGMAWEPGPIRDPRRGMASFVVASPEHHRRGLGKAIMAALQRWFTRDMRREVLLETDDYRLGGIRSYLSLGFGPVTASGNDALRWANVMAGLEGGEA
jgi:L-ascorbate 6-phosphate lactonase